MIDAADAAFLVPPEIEAGEPVRAVLVHHADASVRIAECDEPLAQKANADRRTVRLPDFRRQHDRHPEPAHQLPHAGAGTNTGQQFIVFTAEHRVPRLFRASVPDNR